MPPGRAASSICGHPEAIDLGITNGVLPSAAAISGIALNGIDIAVLTLFHDSCMVRYAISVPVKEDNHAGHRSDGVSGPLPPALEPLNTIRAAAEFWKDTGIKIAALICAPAHEAGTPFYMFRKSVPTPIWFPSHITNLRSGNLYNQLGVIRVIESIIPAKHMTINTITRIKTVPPPAAATEINSCIACAIALAALAVYSAVFFAAAATALAATRLRCAD